MKAWQVHEYGEPEEVLRLDEIPPPTPGPDEVLVRVVATTLNFNDVDGVRGRYRASPRRCPTRPEWRCWDTSRGPGREPGRGSEGEL